MLDTKWELINPDGGYRNKETGEELWWTELAEKYSYDLVKDRKFPILVPTYVNPNSSVKDYLTDCVRKLLSRMTDDKNFPVILFVRKSQEQDYKEAVKDYSFISVVSMQDNIINNLGNARKVSLKWLYTMGYSHAFVFDDDVYDFGKSIRGVTGKGDLKSKAVRSEGNISDTFALWQLAVESLEKQYENLIMTCPYPVGFSWSEDYCVSSKSARLFCGNFNQAICINVKAAIENGFNYRDSDICGHEDIDFILQSTEKDMVMSVLPFLWYSVAPMDLDTFGVYGDTMQLRMTNQQKKMIALWGNSEYVTFREKRGYDQVNMNLRRYRKDKGIENYVIDVWKDGGMLNEN